MRINETVHATQRSWDEISVHKMLAVIISTTYMKTVTQNYAGRLPKEAQDF